MHITLAVLWRITWGQMTLETHSGNIVREMRERKRRGWSVCVCGMWIYIEDTHGKSMSFSQYCSFCLCPSLSAVSVSLSLSYTRTHTHTHIHRVSNRTWWLIGSGRIDYNWKEWDIADIACNWKQKNIYIYP